MRPEGRGVRRLRRLAWRFHRPAWARRHGVWLPVRHPLIPPDLARQIYLGDYERRELEIVAARLEAEDRVLEVGGGIGFLSAYCALRVGSDRVLTYEANPELAPLLRETHARNGVRPRVVAAMLGAGEGEREFRLQPQFFASSAHRAGGRPLTVRQEDRDAVLARERPSFLIVDIEGGEAEFFAGAALDPVRKIVVEVHPDVLGDATLSAMFSQLIGAGFALDFALQRKNVYFFHR